MEGCNHGLCVEAQVADRGRRRSAVESGADLFVLYPKRQRFVRLEFHAASFYPRSMSDVIDPQTLASALEMVRSGQGVSLGSIGGKYGKSLACRAGQFWIDELDEGQSFEREITEEQAMQQLANNPHVVRELLASPIWRQFFEAWVEGARAQAKVALDATIGLPGYAEQFRFVYDAILAWPEQRPSPALREQLKSFVAGGMTLHPLRAAAYALDESAATKKALEYLTALGEMTGWSRSLYQHRADYHERLGNLQAALDDCLLEHKFHGTHDMPARIQKLRAALRVES
jgi:hypothetical protein